jgi:hypothetical protein
LMSGHYPGYNFSTHLLNDVTFELRMIGSRKSVVE